MAISKNRLTEEFDMETLKYNNKGKLKQFMRIQINGELDIDFFEDQSGAALRDTIESFSNKI
jgi:hypothetical protein